MENRARLRRIEKRFLEIPGRQASPAPTWFNLLKTLLQSLGMWIIFLLIGPFFALRVEKITGLDQFSFEWPGQRLVALGLFIVGWLIAWASAYYLVSRGEGTPLPVDATRKLVVAGPYRYVRNPMAFSSLAQGGAIALYFGSPLLVLYIFAGSLLWNYLARPWEEADMARKFGKLYLDYRDEVRCWAPRLRPYSPDSHVSASRPTIAATRTRA